MNQETTLIHDTQRAASLPGSRMTLSNCIEGVGMTMVATDAARTLVPAPFRLVGEDDSATPLVVLAVRGEIALGEHQPTTGIIAQIGLVIVPPDGTGDINVFTCWYYTSHAELARHLRHQGIDGQHVPHMNYTYGPNGVDAGFRVVVGQPGQPLFSIDGSVQQPREQIRFVANWWASSQGGSVKMTTRIPEAFVGEASLTLTTDLYSALGQLVGAASADFSVLQRFNAFAHAEFSIAPYRQ